jgi:hypothetical protein
MPTDHPDAAEPVRLSEDEAHRLLARAVELDSRDTADLSLAQLREVANEAGIAPEAFERALQELEAGHSEPAPRSALSRRMAKSRRLAMLGAVALSAAITPGDLILTTLIFAIPLYGLYEIGIVVARSIERRGGRPSAPLSTGASSADTSVKSPPSFPAGADRLSRSLLFRTA